MAIFNCKICGYSFDSHLTARHDCIQVLKQKANINEWVYVNNVSDIPNGRWLIACKEFSLPISAFIFNSSITAIGIFNLEDLTVYAYKPVDDIPKDKD